MLSDLSNIALQHQVCLLLIHFLEGIKLRIPSIDHLLSLPLIVDVPDLPHNEAEQLPYNIYPNSNNQNVPPLKSLTFFHEKVAHINSFLNCARIIY